jgi:hypothetical protein
MTPHIFTSLSNSYETTIQILEQRIPAPTAQQCMNAIREYAERTTLTQEIGDAATGAARSSRGGNSGCGCGRGCCAQGGVQGGGRGNGRQKHKCTFCKMDNHTSEAWRKRKRTENDTGDTNTSRNDE